MKKTALTKSESEVMYLLWHTDRALSAAEMVALSPQKTWKDSYIHLMVNSLLKKGMITPAGFVKTFRNYARNLCTVHDRGGVCPVTAARHDDSGSRARGAVPLCNDRHGG